MSQEEMRESQKRGLPDVRDSFTRKFQIDDQILYLTVSMYEDKTPGEIFITMSKQGSTISGLMDSIATAVSIGLQHGVPLKCYVDKFTGTAFDPRGYTKDPDIIFVTSIMDYIFRWLGAKFLPKEVEKSAALMADEVPLLQEQPPSCHLCGAAMTLKADKKGYTCLSCGSEKPATTSQEK